MSWTIGDTFEFSHKLVQTFLPQRFQHFFSLSFHFMLKHFQLICSSMWLLLPWLSLPWMKQMGDNSTLQPKLFYCLIWHDSISFSVEEMSESFEDNVIMFYGNISNFEVVTTPVLTVGMFCIWWVGNKSWDYDLTFLVEISYLTLYIPATQMSHKLKGFFV